VQKIRAWWESHSEEERRADKLFVGIMTVIMCTVMVVAKIALF
jgi:hypothetical protein